MLEPKKPKHRKVFKGKRRKKGISKGGTELSFGDYGLKSLGTAWITARQIESARRTIAHCLKKGGKVWIRIFPHKPVTARSGEARMGGGKGSTDHWVFPVKPGRILFEIGGVREELAKEALRLAAHKLPIKTVFIKRD
ncbi:50S ribosomal protein L16 [bacterium]|nr:50S ribosomal protein L16 [bacterium]